MKKYLFTSLFSVAAGVLFGVGLPEIAVDGKSVVDFGEYSAKERKEAFFKITNKGKGILKIGRIRKTCGCAEAKIDKNEIKPGEIGTLRAIVLADSIYGNYSKHVYVFSNAPTQKFLKLTIAGKAVPILEIKPKDTIFTGTIPRGKEFKKEFLLKATANGVKLNEPIIHSDIKTNAALTKKEENLYHLIISIMPIKGKLDFKCKIKIPVTEPKGWKPPEILIFGKIK